MATRSPQGITQLLERWSGGDEKALDQLMPLAYNELHRLAGAYLRPRASRARAATYGLPLAPTQTLRVVTNTIESTTWPLHNVQRRAVVYRSSKLNRDLITGWVERHKTIPTEPANNWRIAL